MLLDESEEHLENIITYIQCYEIEYTLFHEIYSTQMISHTCFM